MVLRAEQQTDKQEGAAAPDLMPMLTMAGDNGSPFWGRAEKRGSGRRK